MNASMQKIVTEKLRFPGCTWNPPSVPLKAWNTAAIVQAIPIPRKTLTALLPVTFPIEESAYFSLIAAIFDAKVSGTDVPKATSDIAVTESFKPIVQPKCEDKSFMSAVKSPIIIIETIKQSQPLYRVGGGTHANTTLQNSVK